MELKKKLGKRIQELRIRNGLKQSELAEKVGIATKHQSCIETGKNYPSAELVENYAKVFGVDVVELLELGHIKPTEDLLKEINTMLNSATEEEIIVAHKILKGLLH
ncbi:MAG: helix-turn-helix transcriptional regulator [Cyanobacteria bacterium SIG28]|nr:helix-turn-helix transcriptional regulator [Cyanobacteria bacterium SIG28]